MALLHNIATWDTITLADLFNDALQLTGNQLDIVEMTMANGRTIAITVISGPHTNEIASAMRDAQQACEESDE